MTVAVAGPSRARQFAAALLARHARARPWAPPAPSVLLHVPSLSHSVLHHSSHFTLSPTITITPLSPPHPVHHIFSPNVVSADRRPADTTWVERVTTRYGRIDAGPPAPRPLGGEQRVIAPSVSIAPPAPQVLRRQPIASAPADDGTPSRATEPWRPMPPASVPAQKPTPMTPADVSRLTDHVMHTLDRRLAAFRDRHGRS